MNGGGPTSTTVVPPSVLPADYPFSQGFWNQVAPNLVGAQMPSFQEAGGSFGGAPSPSQQAGTHMLQQWATSAPQFAGGVQGTLGNLAGQTYMPGSADMALERFLAPSAINPNAAGPGMPNPFSIGGGNFTPPGMGGAPTGGQVPGGPVPGGPPGGTYKDIANDPRYPGNTPAPLGPDRFQTPGGVSSSRNINDWWVYPQFNQPNMAGYGVAPYTPMDPGRTFTPFDPSAGALPMGQGMSPFGMWGASPSTGSPWAPGYTMPDPQRGTGFYFPPSRLPPNPQGPAVPGGPGGPGGGPPPGPPIYPPPGGGGGGPGEEPPPRDPNGDDGPSAIEKGNPTGGEAFGQLPAAGVSGIGSAGGQLGAATMPGTGGGTGTPRWKQQRDNASWMAANRPQGGATTRPLQTSGGGADAYVAPGAGGKWTNPGGSYDAPRPGHIPLATMSYGHSSDVGGVSGGPTTRPLATGSQPPAMGSPDQMAANALRDLTRTNAMRDNSMPGMAGTGIGGGLPPWMSDNIPTMGENTPWMNQIREAGRANDAFAAANPGYEEFQRGGPDGNPLTQDAWANPQEAWLKQQGQGGSANTLGLESMGGGMQGGKPGGGPGGGPGVQAAGPTPKPWEVMGEGLPGGPGGPPQQGPLGPGGGGPGGPPQGKPGGGPGGGPGGPPQQGPGAMPFPGGPGGPGGPPQQGGGKAGGPGGAPGATQQGGPRPGGGGFPVSGQGAVGNPTGGTPFSGQQYNPEHTGNPSSRTPFTQSDLSGTGESLLAPGEHRGLGGGINRLGGGIDNTPPPPPPPPPATGGDISAPPAIQPPAQQQQVSPPTGIYDVYEAGRNRMLEDAQRGIEGAMGQAGFSGNRYGTSAMNQAAEQFRRHSQPFEEQFTQMLYGQGQADLNRQLEAAGMGMEHQISLQNLALQNMLGQGQLGLDFSQWYDQAMRDRGQTMLGVGAAETGRTDDLRRQAYEDYIRNQLGYLPTIMGGMTGTTPASPPPTQTTSGGGTDWLSTVASMAMTAASIYAMTGSDRRMKTNIKKTGDKLGPFDVYRYRYKGTSNWGTGPMAQDVEKVFPDAVLTMPKSEYKVINTPVLMARLVEAQS